MEVEKEEVILNLWRISKYNLNCIFSLEKAESICSWDNAEKNMPCSSIEENFIVFRPGIQLKINF